MRDPIVESTRAIRDEIAREHNYDLRSIFKMLRRPAASGGLQGTPRHRDVRDTEGKIAAAKSGSQRRTKQILLAGRNK